VVLWVKSWPAAEWPPGGAHQNTPVPLRIVGYLQFFRSRCCWPPCSGFGPCNRPRVCRPPHGGRLSCKSEKLNSVLLAPLTGRTRYRARGRPLSRTPLSPQSVARNALALAVPNAQFQHRLEKSGFAWGTAADTCAEGRVAWIRPVFRAASRDPGVPGETSSGCRLKERPALTPLENCVFAAMRFFFLLAG